MMSALHRHTGGPRRQGVIGDGIAVTPITALLAAHQDSIDRLIDCIAPETPELESALLRTLSNFMAWVHQLPASETHHHSYCGGLLDHSLEVALWASQSARGRLGDPGQSGWERRRSERTFVLAVALSGLLHDLGKPVADLMIIDPEGRLTWNPYRGSLFAWAETHALSHYHIQWLRGRGARHRGFSLLILRHVVEPELFDRIREVGPELEASLLRALTQEGGDEDPASLLVLRADQESTVRSLKDPRRETDYGGPSPERILIHAMRHLIHQAVWLPNVPGSPLWYLEHQLYLSWPRAAGDIQDLIHQDRLSGIPLDPELLMSFMLDRGLLAPLQTLDDIPTPLQTLRPEGLDVPLRMLQLRSPHLLFDGVLPASGKIMRDEMPCPGDPCSVDDLSPAATPRSAQGPLEILKPIESPSPEKMPSGSSLKADLQQASDRYDWQIRDHHLFIPHPEAARALGVEPMALIEALEAEDWLEPGGGGYLRKVRVLEGRRGLLLTRTVSMELLKAMKVPKRKSRRHVEARA
jgi:hypothetical protein